MSKKKKKRKLSPEDQKLVDAIIKHVDPKEAARFLLEGNLDELTGLIGLAWLTEDRKEQERPRFFDWTGADE